MLKYFFKNLFLIFLFSFLSSSLLFSSFAFSQSSSKRNQILNITQSTKMGETRVVLELNKLPKYRVFTTKNPDRLIIDLQDVAASEQIKFPESELFKKITFGKNSIGDLRITITLNKKIKIKKSVILNSNDSKKNYRLLIDLTSESEEALKTKENPQKIAGQDSSISTYQETPLNSKIADNILSRVNEETGTVTYIIKNPKKTAIPVVVIDAGHGGKDPGTIGKYARTKEKDITLAYARQLKKHLDQTKKFKTFLTRDKDYFIPLSGRVEKARKLKADLFISLHVNSAPSDEASGLSIYTLSEKSSDKQAEILAQKENKSDIIGGMNFVGTSGDIVKTLIDLSQRDTMNNSASFAGLAIRTCRKEGIITLQNTHRFAGFRVLTAPDVASVLIEIGYSSNKDEEKQLLSLSHQKKLSATIAKSIENYFKISE